MRRTVHLHSRSVACQQVYVGIYAVFLGQQYVVVVIEGEYVISQRRILWHQMQPDAILLHRGLRTQSQSHFVVLVPQSHSCHQSVVEQRAVYLGVEDVVVRRTVDYLCLVGYLHRVVLRIDAHPHRVQFVPLRPQSVEPHVAEDAVLARSPQTEVQLSVVHVIRLRYAVHGILLSALHRQRHPRQGVAYGLLVYGARLPQFVYHSRHAVRASQ